MKLNIQDYQLIDPRKRWPTEIFTSTIIPFNEMEKVFRKKQTNNYPTAIIANTIKGKGVSFMEHKVEWHHKAPKPDQFAKALKEYE